MPIKGLNERSFTLLLASDCCGRYTLQKNEKRWSDQAQSYTAIIYSNVITRKY